MPIIERISQDEGFRTRRYALFAFPHGQSKGGWLDCVDLFPSISDAVQATYLMDRLAWHIVDLQMGMRVE